MCLGSLRSSSPYRRWVANPLTGDNMLYFSDYELDTFLLEDAYRGGFNDPQPGDRAT